VVQAGCRVKIEIYKPNACGTKKEHKKQYKQKRNIPVLCMYMDYDSPSVAIC
jgi:hypothetical protein